MARLEKANTTERGLHTTLHATPWCVFDPGSAHEDDPGDLVREGRLTWQRCGEPLACLRPGSWKLGHQESCLVGAEVVLYRNLRRMSIHKPQGVASGEMTNGPLPEGSQAW